MRAGHMLCALLLAAPVTAAAQEPADEPRTLTVNAQGTVEREPEIGIVMFAVENEAETARAAADANAEQMTGLVAALRRAGVQDRNIRTLSYELQPQYSRQVEPTNEPPRIVGYRAINMVQVTVDTVARLGGIIDVAIANGANRVTNISYQLSDPEGAQNEAAAVAMRNARRQAEALAEAAGEQLGPPLNISTAGYRMPPPSPMYARAEMAMDMAMAPTPVETGTLTVTAAVNVVYQLMGTR